MKSISFQNLQIYQIAGVANNFQTFVKVEMKVVRLEGLRRLPLERLYAPGGNLLVRKHIFNDFTGA
jgi:hypothetical protein